MENLSLYQLTNDFINFMNIAEKEELTEVEFSQIAEMLTSELQKKSTNIIGYYKNQDSLINAIDEQIKRLQAYKKSKENNLSRYKDYVKANMERLGITKLETPVGALSIAKSPISVEVVDESLIPKDYKQAVTEIKIDKKKILEDFKSTGELISGVTIHSDNTNLRIK